MERQIARPVLKSAVNSRKFNELRVKLRTIAPAFVPLYFPALRAGDCRERAGAELRERDCDAGIDSGRGIDRTGRGFDLYVHLHRQRDCHDCCSSARPRHEYAARSSGLTEATVITSAGSVQGTVNGTAVTFSNVPIPAGTATITITNVRINASLVTSPTITEVALVQSGVSPFTNFVTDATIVAMNLPGLAAGTGGSQTYSACANITPASGPAFLVKFSENFPSAFKIQGGPENSLLGAEFTANTETGYSVSAGGANNQATSGTRARILFSGVPAGASLYVPLTITSGSATLALTASEAGPFAQVAFAPTPGFLPVGQVAIAGGTGEAVYEVTAQNPSVIETFAVPVYLDASAASLTGSSITATAGLAPVGAASNVPVFSPSATETITTTASAAASCLLLTILPTILPLAEQGAPYVQPLAASGVTTWALVNGSNPLPAGLSLNTASGVISGTPTVNGAFSFTIQMTGAANNASQSFTLQIAAPVSITITTMPSVQQGAAYSQTLTATNGLGSLSWSILSGSLPTGLWLNGSTGQISGNVSATGIGTSSFTVKVNDSWGSTAEQALSIQVTAASVLCTSPPTDNPTLRAEGVTELLAELVVNCQGNGGTGTFQITLPNGAGSAYPITSKVLNGSVTEAALITNSSTTLGTIDGTGTVLTFSGVAVPAGNTTFTITNVRVNATAALYPQIVEQLVSTGVASVGPSTNVGYILPTLASPGITGVSNYAACGPITAANGPSFTIHARELIVDAFKVQQSALNSTLGSGYQGATETGFLVSSNGVSNVANSGTRVRVLFHNVPANVNLYVPLSITTTTPDTAVLTLTPSETGPFSAVAAVTPTAGNTLPASPALGLVTISGGNGEAVYEVTTLAQAIGEIFNIPVYLVANGAVTATGSIAATVSYAPVGATSNVPNFVSNATPQNASSIGLCLVSSTLPDAQLAKPYGPVTLSAGGGTSPYTFSNAVLPPGLGMSPGGTVTGTPSTAGGTFSSSVTITDAHGVTGQFALQIQVQETNPLTISTTSLPAGYQGVPYSQTLQVSGGTPAYTWTLASGSLSGTGLALNSATGAITGTPSAIGSISLTARVTDVLGVVVTQNLTLQVNAAQPVITSITGGGVGPTGVAPGGVASIFGSTLAFLPGQNITTPWPTSLSGVSVTVNGIAAPLDFAEPQQIILQIPYEIAPGPATVIVNNGVAVSSSFQIQVNATAPGIIAVQNPGVMPEQLPANSTAWVTYTGAGVTNPPLPDGDIGTAAPVQTPTVSINGVPVVVTSTVMANAVGWARAVIQVPALASGDYHLTVTVGGVQSPPVPIQIVTTAQLPPPQITSITPNSAAAGTSSAPILVTVQNVTFGSTISWTAPNGSQTSITPSLIQGTQVTATVPAALLTTPGTAQLAIVSPSGVQSNSVAFTITAPNWITSISPASAPAGGAAATLTLAGPFFSGTPTVTWTSPGGQTTVLTPSQIAPQQISVPVPSSLLQTPGFAQVGVTGSNQLPFTINTATGIVNPSTVPYGSADTPITVTGASLFGSGSVVQWTRPDGKTTTITPSLVQGAQIAATVPAALLTTPGTAQVAIADPSGILSSPALPFTISSPLSITGLTPNLQTAGSGAIPITVTGATALTSGTTVTWTGPNGQVTNLGGLISAAQIAATVSAALLSSPGTAQVGLVDGSGVLSNQLPFNVAPFNISSVTPNATASESTATQVTIAGANLTGAANVVWTAPGGQTTQFRPIWCRWRR